MPIELSREEEATVAAMDAHNRGRFERTVRVHLEHFSPHEAGEPLIRSTPGLMGGDDCIRKTRIPVWMLVAYKKYGESDADPRAVGRFLSRVHREGYSFDP